MKKVTNKTHGTVVFPPHKHVLYANWLSFPWSKD